MAEGYERRVAVLSLGFGGVAAECRDGCHITYYDRRTAPYLGDVIMGGYVIDKRPAINQHGAGVVLRSPMVDGKLAPGDVDRFDRSRLDGAGGFVARAITEDAENPVAGLAGLMLADPTFGGFDFVAPDQYAAYWGRHGAAVGIRTNDKIVWTDGREPTPIPAFAERFTAETNAPRGD